MDYLKKMACTVVDNTHINIERRKCWNNNSTKINQIFNLLSATLGSQMANSSSTSSNVDFLADHPFLFVIRNLNFSLDLLIGRVFDPNPEKVIKVTEKKIVVEKFKTLISHYNPEEFYLNWRNFVQRRINSRK